MRISKLSPSARVEGRWLCQLEDGTLLTIGEGEVVSFGLGTGVELDAETLEALTAAARLTRVKEKALELLAARPMSRKELVDKLTARPRNREKEPLCGADTAGQAADWLEGLGYLDDGQYARAVAEHCAAKGYGPGRIREELYRRGVPRDLWEEALTQAEDPAEAIDAFVAKKLKGAAVSDPKELKKVSDALARRGFRWEDISAGLRRLGAEPEE
mgnify:CR=1 FL=1